MLFRSYLDTTDWVLVQKDGISINQSFATLFAYPQIHIEEVLIPKIETVINSLILDNVSVTRAQLLAQIAADTTKVFYLSSVARTDSTFGNEDSYEMLYHKCDLPKNQQTITVSDTIANLKQAISAWEERLAQNEEAKVKAKLLQNYSFQAGASIEYSETYTTSKSHESTFFITLGGKVANDMMMGAADIKTKFAFEEKIMTTQGGTFTSEVQREQDRKSVV